MPIAWTARAAMAVAELDTLFVSAPEALYWISGYLSDWYQAQSPVIWPPTSGIAIHCDHDRTIHFENAAEELQVGYTSVSDDV